MLEFLRDDMWQFIGAMLGFVAICITVVLYFRQRRCKALTYEIVSCTGLLSVKEGMVGKIKVVFNGEPVRGVHLVVVKVINSGNIAITRNDYDRPVALSVSGEGRILTAEVLEKSPSSLQPELTVGSTDLVIEPILLNGGDFITIKMLLSEFDGGSIHAHGRIIGIKDIRELKQRQGVVRFVVSLLLGVIIGSLLGALLAVFVVSRFGFSWAVLTCVLVLSAMGLLAAYVHKKGFA